MRSCSTKPMVGGAMDEVGGAGGASAFENDASSVRSALTAAASRALRATSRSACTRSGSDALTSGHPTSVQAQVRMAGLSLHRPLPVAELAGAGGPVGPAALVPEALAHGDLRLAAGLVGVAGAADAPPGGEGELDAAVV